MQPPRHRPIELKLLVILSQFVLVLVSKFAKSSNRSKEKCSANIKMGVKNEKVAAEFESIERNAKKYHKFTNLQTV